MSRPGNFVDAVTKPEPAAFGLLSPAVPVVIDNSAHWLNRVNFLTVNCGVHVRLNSISSAVTGVDVVTPDPDAPLFRSYFPFDIEADFTASTFGFKYLDYDQIAKDYLELAQQKAIEFELWTGELAQKQKTVWDTGNDSEAFPNQWLASTDAIDVTPAAVAVKPKYALALLEQALADCGAGVAGVIHTTRDVASSLGVNLKVENKTLVTVLGNSVVAGTGYTGTGPDGTAAAGTAVWMYATGPVTVRLGPITATPDTRSQSVDVSKNTVHVYASRPAAVSWDSCCHYAVLVDLALDYA